MFEQDVVKPGFIVGYILSLLGLSWGIAAISGLGLVPASSLMVIPFIPGLLALLFLSLEGHPADVHARPLLRPVTVPSVMVAVAYPCLLLGLATLVALGTGLGYLKAGPVPVVSLSLFLLAVLASFGQEFGYRGYLLPALTYWEGRIPATVWVGTVWGLAMAPFSFLALPVAGTGDPLTLAILGFLLTLAVAFAFSCCSYLSESLLPPVLMNLILTPAVPAVFPATWIPPGSGEGGLIGVTWPSPLPLILLVALAFVPVFSWFFTVMDGEIGGDSL